jgi:hypothetical protein
MPKTLAALAALLTMCVNVAGAEDVKTQDFKRGTPIRWREAKAALAQARRL